MKYEYKVAYCIYSELRETIEFFSTDRYELFFVTENQPHYTLFFKREKQNND